MKKKMLPKDWPKDVDHDLAEKLIGSHVFCEDELGGGVIMLFFLKCHHVGFMFLGKDNEYGTSRKLNTVCPLCAGRKP